MRIAVKNLPVRITESELREYFEKKWKVTDVYMLKNTRGVFRRVAFVGFSTTEDAESAVEYFNGAMFCNQKISVEIAKEEEKETERGEVSLRQILYSKTICVFGLKETIEDKVLFEELSKLGKVLIMERISAETLKVKFMEGSTAVRAAKSLRVLAGMRIRVGAYREDLQKKANDHFNSLFFSFDAVLKKCSDIAKMKKSDIVSTSDTLLGSRMAVMETGLVEQTKEFLGRHRIFLDKLTGESNKNVLILRCADILGAVDRVKENCAVDVAPSGCLALLTFKDSADAESVRKSLNMRRHKSHIMYCEYAPLSRDDGTDKITNEESDKLNDQSIRKSNKIVVKNVPFQATVEDLKAIFSSYAKVIDVRLPMKEAKMHRGFAFVITDSPKSVEAIISRFGTSTHLFGRRLVLEKAKM